MSTHVRSSILICRSLAVKRNPELNVKLVGNINHNKKHSEVDLDVRYGADFKDEEKHIDLSASMDRAIKSWSSASAAMNAQFSMGKVFYLIIALFSLFGLSVMTIEALLTFVD